MCGSSARRSSTGGPAAFRQWGSPTASPARRRGRCSETKASGCSRRSPTTLRRRTTTPSSCTRKSPRSRPSSAAMTRHASAGCRSPSGGPTASARRWHSSRPPRLRISSAGPSRRSTTSTARDGPEQPTNCSLSIWTASRPPFTSGSSGEWTSAVRLRATSAAARGPSPPAPAASTDSTAARAGPISMPFASSTKGRWWTTSRRRCCGPRRTGRWRAAASTRSRISPHPCAAACPSHS